MYIPENVNTNCGIYLIRNIRDGKKYIGSTKNAEARKSKHFKQLNNDNHHCDDLQAAWNEEHDKSVFKFMMFIYCKESDLKKIEQGCFDTMHPDYNSSGYAHRIEHTAAVRKKMSDAKIGKPGNRLGVKSSPETCAKISAKKTGKPSPKKGKPSGVIPWNKGKQSSQNTKQKLSSATYKMWEDPEYREKQADAHSSHTKLLWENTEYKESHVKRTTDRWLTPEFRWVQMLNAWHRTNVYWQRYYGA